MNDILNKPNEAYEEDASISEKEDWIVIGEIGNPCVPFYLRKWSDIVTDLSQKYPKVFNIRNTQKGIYIDSKNSNKKKSKG